MQERPILHMGAAAEQVPLTGCKAQWGWSPQWALCSAKSLCRQNAALRRRFVSYKSNHCAVREAENWLSSQSVIGEIKSASASRRLYQELAPGPPIAALALARGKRLSSQSVIGEIKLAGALRRLHQQPDTSPEAQS